MAAAVKERSNNNPISLTPAGESDEERLEFIELMTKNCDEVQQQMLADILEQNKDTEYLRRHGLGGATDRASFKSKVPVVTYNDLQPYIQRIVDGDRSAILSGQPISEFYTSSGTTGGERKLVPIVKDELDRRQLVNDLILPIMKQYVSGLDRGRGLYFIVVKSESKTPGGLIARTVVTSYCKSPQFKSSLQKTLTPYTSPLDAILCPDSHQSMYIQMLCALYLRLEVNRAGSVFASGFLHAIHFLQTHWKQLAADIAAGSLSPSITDPSLHDSVAGILRPDPELAHFITDECSQPGWAGIITRIWPNTKYIDLIITGPMAQYIPILQFYSGGLPIASTMYGSSECYFGINLNPMCPTSEISYLMLPNLGYFEFSPIEGEDEDELVDLAAVELGKDYEVVVTTHSGLYRYRLGDILRVVGFYHSCPKFMFLKRKSVVLSIDSDKTDEAELQTAVLRAANVLAPFGISVVEYTSHAWTRTIPGHYIIYWELLWQQNEDEGGLNKGVEGEIIEKCCLEIEEALNSVYRQCRVESRSIGPLEIRVVRARTFEKLMDYSISMGASISQYKVPRCVNLKPILELLDSRVVSSHFSQTLPKWTPNRFQKND